MACPDLFGTYTSATLSTRWAMLEDPDFCGLRYHYLLHEIASFYGEGIYYLHEYLKRRSRFFEQGTLRHAILVCDLTLDSLEAIASSFPRPCAELLSLFHDAHRIESKSGGYLINDRLSPFPDLVSPFVMIPDAEWEMLRFLFPWYWESEPSPEAHAFTRAHLEAMLFEDSRSE